MKYQTRPEVVDAEQWDGHELLVGMIDTKAFRGVMVSGLEVKPGDWIVRLPGYRIEVLPPADFIQKYQPIGGFNA